MLCSLHSYTIRQEFDMSSHDIGFNYYRERDTDDVDYTPEMKFFFESRGLQWSLKNKHFNKIRDMLRDFEDLLANSRCLTSTWLTDDIIQFVLSNGVFANLYLSPAGDVRKIQLDKYLAGKLASEHTVDVVVTDNYVVFSYVENKFTLVSFGKKAFSTKSGKVEKLASLDPKVNTIEINSVTGRRLQRKLVSNGRNYVCSWWRCGSEELWPWSPTQVDRSNLYLYGIAESKMELLSLFNTESDPVCVDFVPGDLNQITALELRLSSCFLCTYEIANNKINKIESIAIDVSSEVVCCDLKTNANRAAIACADGTILICDKLSGVCQKTSSVQPISLMSWHPSGHLLTCGTSDGLLKLYDISLSPVALNLIGRTDKQNSGNAENCGLHIGKYFKHSVYLQLVRWSSGKDVSKLVLLFDRGPLTIAEFKTSPFVCDVFDISVYPLVANYMQMNQIQKALSVLYSLNWNFESGVTYNCVNLVVNHLLRQPFTHKVESDLELSLGAFFNPSHPIRDRIILQFRERMAYLARRFFFVLLRNHQFEKAYLLAIDIGTKDLFMHLHYVANDCNEESLATVALDKAREIESGSRNVTDTEPSDSCSISASSTCSSHSSFSPTPPSSYDSSCSSSVTSDDQDDVMFAGAARRTSAPTLAGRRSLSGAGMENWSLGGSLSRDTPPALPPKPKQMIGQGDASSQSRPSTSSSSYLKPLPAVVSNAGQDSTIDSDSDDQNDANIHVVHFGIV